jgi:hypothetical protein
MIQKLQNYNKQILAVVSMLLLVVFLAPTAVTQCSRLNTRPSTVWATTDDGTKMTIGDMEELRGQLAVLELMRDPLTQGLGIAKNPDHWWLLVKEAKDAGMVGGIDDGKAALQAAASAARPPRNADELLGQLCASTRQQPQTVLRTLANLRGVERMVSLVVGSGRTSEARARLGARELLTDVAADVVPIDAATVSNAVATPAPTPEQLTATFEKGKGSLYGTGPGGIGYKYPDRVHVEWLVIPASEVIHSLAAEPALGAVELRKEFRRNPAAYGVPAADLEPGKPAPSYDAYAAKVRDAVEHRLLKERAERISTAVREWSRMAMKDIPVQGGIAKLPAEWKTRAPALAALSAELAQKFGIPAPAVESAGGAWLTAEEIDSNPFLGKATTQEFGQAMRIGEIVKDLREFKADGRLPIQAGVIGPVANTTADDLVVWRVTDAEAAHEPKSIDEVRDAVAKDAATQARYDALVAKLPEIAEQAKKDGLDAVAKAYGTTVEKAAGIHLAEPMVLRQYGIRLPGSMPKAGSDVDALRAVIAKAVSLPTANPVNTLPDADRILAVPVASKLAVVVVRINQVKLLTVEDFRSFESGGTLRAALGQDEPKFDWKVAFGKDALVKRSGYKLKNPQGPDRPQAPEAPSL